MVLARSLLPQVLGVLGAMFAIACGGGAPQPVAAPASPPATTVASAAAAASGGVPAAPPGGGAVAATDAHAVSFPNGGSGWLQAPAGAGKHAALLVIPEWWGLTDWIKQDVARFAARGDVAVAVDLYRGKVASDAAEAHELSRGLPEDRAMEDMKTAYDWLAARPDVNPQRIGIIGWCMGGGYALAFAVAEPRLRAAVVNYGKLVTAPEKINAVHAALLGNFAGADRGIAPEDVRAFSEKLKAAHKDADVKIYDGARHAFMNPTNKDAYDEAAARDAWARIDAFLARTLGG
jgi:carboxymethylenebutenolidase